MQLRVKFGKGSGCCRAAGRSPAAGMGYDSDCRIRPAEFLSANNAGMGLGYEARCHRAPAARKGPVSVVRNGRSGVFLRVTLECCLGTRR